MFFISSTPKIKNFDEFLLLNLSLFYTKSLKFISCIIGQFIDILKKRANRICKFWQMFINNLFEEQGKIEFFIYFLYVIYTNITAQNPFLTSNLIIFIVFSNCYTNLIFFIDKFFHKRFYLS